MPDSQAQTGERGELRAALAAGVVPPGRRFAELGGIAAGMAPGRREAGQIIIADLTGTGVQDTAIATFAFARARERGLGAEFAA